MSDLTERLLDPETVEAAIAALVQGIYQNIRASLAVPEVKAAVDTIRELHRRLATAKLEGAAEALDSCESWLESCGNYSSAMYVRERAAALRKQVQG